MPLTFQTPLSVGWSCNVNSNDVNWEDTSTVSIGAALDTISSIRMVSKIDTSFSYLPLSYWKTYGFGTLANVIDERWGLGQLQRAASGI